MLARGLKDEKIDIIYHSPMKRAVQTSEAINSYHNVQREVLDNFVEIDLGDWEGMEFNSMVEMNSEFHQEWMSDPTVQIPGGESFNQVFERVKPGVVQILESNHKNIVIVGHATVNRAILAGLMNMETQVARMFRMKNCALSKILVYENNKGMYSIVESWNDTAHLDGEV